MKKPGPAPSESSSALPPTDADNDEVRRILELDSPRTSYKQAHNNAPVRNPAANREQRIKEIRAAAFKRREEKNRQLPPQLDPSSPLAATQSPALSAKDKEIRLSGCPKSTAFSEMLILSDDSIAVLQRFLAAKPKAISVDLQKNNIKGLGAQRLVRILLEHGKTEYLDISDNKELFGEVEAAPKNSEYFTKRLAAEAFSSLLKGLRSLSVLSINNCGLTDDCAPMIAQGLTENAELTFLDLAQNQLTDYGTKLICQALEEHPSLSQLLIHGNKLTDEGGQALLVLLTKNQRISIIEICNTDISEGLYREIKEKAKQNWLQNNPNAASSSTQRISSSSKN